jgi:hypothetical protein
MSQSLSERRFAKVDHVTNMRETRPENGTMAFF